MYVCEIIKFVYSTYIIISNQETHAKKIMYVGIINLCTAVTTKDSVFPITQPQHVVGD